MAIRSRASEAREVGTTSRKGWFKSDVDPMDLLESFPAIRLQNQYVLRAYRWCYHSEGTGRIWAMPRNAAFPEPNNCPWAPVRKLLRLPPKPAMACADVMQVIVGDGSPLSYLSASLFGREASEFGAMRHRLTWSTCTVLGADPWENSPPTVDWWPSADERRWRWYQPRPSEWRPVVELCQGRAIVTLFVYCGCGVESIRKLTDTFTAGDYRYKTNDVLLAVGPVTTMF